MDEESIKIILFFWGGVNKITIDFFLFLCYYGADQCPLFPPFLRNTAGASPSPAWSGMVLYEDKLADRNPVAVMALAIGVPVFIGNMVLLALPFILSLPQESLSVAFTSMDYSYVACLWGITEFFPRGKKRLFATIACSVPALISVMLFSREPTTKLVSGFAYHDVFVWATMLSRVVVFTLMGYWAVTRRDEIYYYED